MRLLSFCSPESLLASIFLNNDTPTLSFPATVLVTGGRGAGKTHWCQELLQAARAPDAPWQGLAVRGLISPGLMWEAQRVGIQLQDAESGQSRILACRREATGRESPGFESGLFQVTAGLETSTWRFAAGALAWGNQVLERVEACDLLVLDELGPLEFERETGLQAGLALVDRGAFRLACVVVRPELVDEALRRWPEAALMTVPAGGPAPSGGRS